MATHITAEMRESLSEDEVISLHLSKMLDGLGYSQQMRQFRKDVYQENDRLINDKYPTLRIVSSGSKGEGLTKPYESDHDMLALEKGVVCTEEGLVEFAKPEVAVFTFSPEYPHPGYNLLNLHRRSCVVDEIIVHSLVPKQTGPILSSDVYVNTKAELHKQSQVPGVTKGRVGPAVSQSIGKSDMDKVYSLPSVNPSVLLEWYQRPRHHDWPSSDLRQRILQMNGNFVAKGCKGSTEQQDEWRQCFNEAELLLVDSWEDMLAKLYVLLKVVLKEILRRYDKTKVLTSYIMKNIVFWLAESNPIGSFQDKALLQWLMRALRTLRHALRTGYLPYYMIPGRNLLGDDIPDRVRAKLITCIKRLLREGPGLLLRCKKFKFTRFTTHEELYQFGSQRDELEMADLSWHTNMRALGHQGLSIEERMKDTTCMSLYRRWADLVNSPWPRHIQDQFYDSDDDYDKAEIILS